jgi:hypothetical protein
MHYTSFGASLGPNHRSSCCCLLNIISCASKVFRRRCGSGCCYSRSGTILGGNLACSGACCHICHSMTSTSRPGRDNAGQSSRSSSSTIIFDVHTGNFSGEFSRLLFGCPVCLSSNNSESDRLLDRPTVADLYTTGSKRGCSRTLECTTSNLHKQP